MTILLEEHFEGGTLGGDALTQYEGFSTTPRLDANIGFTRSTISSGGPGISQWPVFVAGRSGLGVTDTTEGGSRTQTLILNVTASPDVMYVSGWYHIVRTGTPAGHRLIQVRNGDIGRFLAVTYSPYSPTASAVAEIDGRPNVTGVMPLGGWVQMEIWYDPVGTARVKIGDVVDTGVVPAPVGQSVTELHFALSNGAGMTYTLDDVLITHGSEPEPTPVITGRADRVRRRFNR